MEKEKILKMVRDRIDELRQLDGITADPSDYISQILGNQLTILLALEKLLENK